MRVIADYVCCDICGFSPIEHRYKVKRWRRSADKLGWLKTDAIDVCDKCWDKLVKEIRKVKQ